MRSSNLGNAGTTPWNKVPAILDRLCRLISVQLVSNNQGNLWEHMDLCSIFGSPNFGFMQYWIGSAVLHLCSLLTLSNGLCSISMAQ